MTATEGRVGYASEIDAFAYGEHRITPAPAGPGPVRRFTGRLSADGSSGYPAEPGRYHLYAGWFCPRSHRATIALALLGLTGTVSVSYVDGLRDGRGWAFRERTGADPINGFTLLREAYEATDARFDGAVSVPVLWDRQTGRIVSNNPDTIDLDLATAFAAAATEPTDAPVDLYPPPERDRIDELNRQVAALERTITRAVYHDAAKYDLRAMLHDVDERLGRSRFLLGPSLTAADLRLWVILVRYDAGPNANGAAGPPLTTFANLWAYARDLYARPAFHDTTDFGAFAAPFTRLPDWTQSSDGAQSLRSAAEIR